MTATTIGASILVVDDTPANALALESILDSLGQRIVRAGSGEEALKCLLVEDFAVILLDVQMPGLDGFETAALIKGRERTRHIPIIFLTAHSRDTAQICRGYAEGAVDYLLKPFEPEILHSKVSVFVDLHLKTEQIRQQAALIRKHELETLERKNELRFRRLTDSMPQIAWAMRPDGEIYYSNQVWLQFSGLAPDESTVERCREVVHPSERPHFEAQWAAALESGEAFETQYRLRRHRDGCYRWHLGRAVPELGDDGQLIGWIATATDIEDQKRIEEQLHALAIELQEAVSARDDFLSIASHELRTPLTSLQLTVQSLLHARSGAPDQDSLVRKLKMVEQQVRRQVRLVENLLNVSRITAGRLELDIEAVDLAELAHEVAGRFENELASAGCSLELRADSPVVGQWDRMGMDQVLTNLLSNAVKYGEGKPIVMTIDAGGDANDGLARVRVSDRGIGIAPEDQSRLFERFGRAVSSQTYGGFGLGLWISRQIVESSGGSIQLISEPGSGSTFTVELPRSVAGAVVAAPSPLEDSQAAGG